MAGNGAEWDTKGVHDTKGLTFLWPGFYDAIREHGNSTSHMTEGSRTISLTIRPLQIQVKSKFLSYTDDEWSLIDAFQLLQVCELVEIRKESLEDFVLWIC